MQSMSASISSQQWDSHKNRILSLYINCDYKLKNVQKILADEEGFHASEAQYRGRFKVWNVRKRPLRGPGGRRTASRIESHTAVAEVNQSDGSRDEPSDELGAGVGRSEPLSSCWETDGEMPNVPPGSSQGDSKVFLEHRDPSRSSRSDLLTARTHAECEGTRTIGRAHGNGMCAFQGQEPNETTFMACNLNDLNESVMRTLAGLQADGEAPSQGASLFGDQTNAAVSPQMGDSFWGSEARYWPVAADNARHFSQRPGYRSRSGLSGL